MKIVFLWSRISSTCCIVSNLLKKELSTHGEVITAVSYLHIALLILIVFQYLWDKRSPGYISFPESYSFFYEMVSKSYFRLCLFSKLCVYTLIISQNKMQNTFNAYNLHIDFSYQSPIWKFWRKKPQVCPCNWDVWALSDLYKHSWGQSDTSSNQVPEYLAKKKGRTESCGKIMCVYYGQKTLGFCDLNSRWTHSCIVGPQIQYHRFWVLCTTQEVHSIIVAFPVCILW